MTYPFFLTASKKKAPVIASPDSSGRGNLIYCDSEIKSDCFSRLRRDRNDISFFLGSIKEEAFVIAAGGVLMSTSMGRFNSVLDLTLLLHGAKQSPALALMWQLWGTLSEVPLISVY